MKKLKITKDQQVKMYRKVNRELELERGRIRGGAHKTNKDRPRKKKINYEQEF